MSEYSYYNSIHFALASAHITGMSGCSLFRSDIKDSVFTGDVNGGKVSSK